MVANLEVFENDFMLTEEEMNDIFALNKDQSYVIQSGGIP